MTTEHTPGTWGWACAQLVEGRTVFYPSKLFRLSILEGYLAEGVHDRWYYHPIIRPEHLTATDWEVVE